MGTTFAICMACNTSTCLNHSCCLKQLDCHDWGMWVFIDKMCWMVLLKLMVLMVWRMVLLQLIISQADVETRLTDHEGRNSGIFKGISLYAAYELTCKSSFVYWGHSSASLRSLWLKWHIHVDCRDKRFADECASRFQRICPKLQN